MHITRVQIKNFRCFGALDISFISPIILIEGVNGAGKTSLLEALHYVCYLRSFRTHTPQELVQFGKDNFFIKLTLHPSDSLDPYDLQVGFSNKKRLVKINNKVITSYKELLPHYRIVTLTEDDLALVKEGPEVRRLFIDQAIAFDVVDFAHTIKKCRDIVEQRMVLLKKNGSYDSYQLWTEQLWQISKVIQEQRTAALTHLEHQVSIVIKKYFDDSFTIQLKYMPKKPLLDSFDDFIASNPYLYQNEQRMQRSLFGAHLDDFAINFKDTYSKNFASRGQQKLIVLLIKIAQIRLLSCQNKPVILLLDDFMTDFDTNKAQLLINLLADLGIQLIFTIPTADSFLQKELAKRQAYQLKLTA